MSKPFKRPKLPKKLSAKRSKGNFYITRSGNRIVLNKNMRGKRAMNKDARSRAKAAYLATLPKGRVKRTLYRMHPKRVAGYWFSREGGIMALKVTGIGILASFLLLVGIFAFFRKDLPNLRGLYGKNPEGSIRYYDRTGKVLLFEDYDAIKRTIIKDDEIPEIMKQATIAVEDKDFYHHGGFDTRGIMRAGVNNVMGKGSTQGGSTITQQLVKLTQNWTKDRTYTRKVKELILSVELEKTYSKNEILDGYLNTAPYGDITYGIEASMQDYFQKPAKKMTLDEAAFLAAIPKSPTYYSPYGASFDKKLLKDRQDYVLDLMQQQGMITTEQRDAAKKINTLKKLKKRAPKYTGIKAPWFVLTAKEQLQAKYGADTVNRGGWEVITTLDMDLQKKAEDQIAQGLQRVKWQGGDVAAFAAEDVKTGQMVALVGGTDFNNPEYGQNNYARLKLPPGSSIKPYDYLSLIENTSDFGAGSVLYDSPDPLPGYPCTNKNSPDRGGNCLRDYDLRYPGPITLRYALGGSRNIPAVKAMLIAGVQKTQEIADKIGLKDKGNGLEGAGYKCYSDDELTQEKECGGSAGIGDGAYLKLDEHVHGFATLSRSGRLLPQTYILKITDAGGNKVDEWKPTPGKQAVRDEAAYIVSDMIEDPNASYFGIKSHRFNGWHFGFKTGTTNDRKDGWMMAESTRYAAGVWVGYHDRSREMTGAMETMTQPIMQNWMNEVHQNLKPEERPRPKGLQTLPAFVVRNHVGYGSVEPSPSTDLFPSWYQKQNTASNKDIDIVSNKLATNCTPSRAKRNASNANANAFSADPFHGGGSFRGGNTSEKDDVHKCDDAKPFVMLSGPDTCTPSGTFVANIRKGTHPLSSDRFKGTVNFIVGGKTIKSVNINSDGTVKFSCSSVSTSGRQSVDVEVIDSVLYDYKASITTNFPAKEKAPVITGATEGGKVFWSGGNGTVYTNGGASLCSGNGNCDLPGYVNEGAVIYVKTSSGKSSNFTVTGS